MKKKNYFVGVRFNNDKTLFDKVSNHPMSNSDLIRKAVRQYFMMKEENQSFNMGGYNQEFVNSLNDHIKFLQEEVSFLHKQNAYLSLPWYKRMVYQLEGKKE